jgi:flagellar basal-body rod modification protein FlgD
MAISATGNSSLDALSNSYKSNDKEKNEKSDALGMDTFLTMLVAQLKNQDPLNPMEGSDFSAQLAQFSQLEQLMNLNDSVDSMKESEGSGSQTNVTDYVGKIVTGDVDSIEVVEGTPFGGLYNIKKSADVMVKVYDKDGNEVRTLYPGQKVPGTYDFKWDGKDNAGQKVGDGSYKYTVLANEGAGFVAIPTSVTGTVESIVYNEGKAYLKVQGILVDPASLVQVGNPAEVEKSTESPVDYLGRKITTSHPVISYDGSAKEAAKVKFELLKDADATVRIFDASGQQIQTITVVGEDLKEGDDNPMVDKEAIWDGKDSRGNTMPEGLYSYAVTVGSEAVDVSMSENVSEIRVINGTQFLVLGDSGFLSTVGTITNVKEI